MLSEAEWCVLRQIEVTTAADDPRFAAALAKGRCGKLGYGERQAHHLIAAFAVLLGLLCLLMGQAGAGCVALLFAVIVIVRRYLRFPVRPVRRPDIGTGR
jgi:hypothetical protein